MDSPHDTELTILSRKHGSRFTGKERDTESGNDYFGARYYNSATGRFLSPDWSAKEEPVPYAKLGDPQSLNLYSYVGNNPLSRVDPDGHVDVAAQCKGKATCSMTVVDTVSKYHQKDGKSVLDYTVAITTKFSLTTDAKGKTNVSATSTAVQTAGTALGQSKLDLMGKISGMVQADAVTKGYGSTTTQAMSALGIAETGFGTDRPGEKAPWKAPDINPLQWSGGHARGQTLEQNIQGALGVYSYFGRPSQYDPIATYSAGYSDKGANTLANFTSTYDSVSEDVK